jgi:hypothetical protein
LSFEQGQPLNAYDTNLRKMVPAAISHAPRGSSCTGLREEISGKLEDSRRAGHDIQSGDYLLEDLVAAKLVLAAIPSNDFDF